MKKILILLLIALIVIQFIRPAKNVSSAAQVNDITQTLAVPDDVHAILRKACYDCHSNNTHYPWYANVQPVYWWLNNHIEEGKDELNFSEFAQYKLRRKLKKLNEISEQVTEGEMPLGSYTWMHKEAKLSSEETKLLVNWANRAAAQLGRDSLLTLR